MKYGLLLRGVNVGGVKLAMADLAKELNKLGLKNVRTIIQSGNAVFATESNKDDLIDQLKLSLEKAFAYKSQIFLYTIDEIRRIVEQYPFKRTTDKHSYAVFCSNKEVARELLSSAKKLDQGIESVALGNSCVYWTVPKGSTLTTTFAKELAKNNIKAGTTNRNINTLEKMIQAI